MSSAFSRYCGTLNLSLHRFDMASQNIKVFHNAVKSISQAPCLILLCPEDAAEWCNQVFSWIMHGSFVCIDIMNLVHPRGIQCLAYSIPWIFERGNFGDSKEVYRAATTDGIWTDHVWTLGKRRQHFISFVQVVYPIAHGNTLLPRVRGRRTYGTCQRNTNFGDVSRITSSLQYLRSFTKM